MADLKISQLSDGGNSQATDEYVIARSGANYRIDGASIAAAATSVGTLTSLTVSGTARFASSAGSTQGVRVYGAAGANQWDIYTNSTNLRISDNTGGGSLVVDTGATFGNAVTITGPNVGNTSLIVRNANSANSGEVLLGGTTYGAKITRDSLGADQDLLIVNSHGGAQGFKFRTGSTTAGTTDLLLLTGAGKLLLSKDNVIGINTTDGSDNGYLALVAANADGEQRGGGMYLHGNERSSEAGNVVLQAGNVSGGAIVFRSGASIERARINAGAPILCLAGGNTTATGTGIAFPATQSASSDANTLDDYEEGTFTPTLSGSGGSAGSYAQTDVSGTYTKIGRIVTATAYLSVTNLGSWSGNVLCSLPFTPNDVSKGAIRVQQHTFTGTVVPEPSGGGAEVRFNLTASGTGQNNWQWSSLVTTAGNFINFTLTYVV